MRLTLITHQESSVETVAAHIQDDCHMWQEQKNTMTWKENTSTFTFQEIPFGVFPPVSYEMCF